MRAEAATANGFDISCGERAKQCFFLFSTHMNMTLYDCVKAVQMVTNRCLSLDSEQHLRFIYDAMHENMLQLSSIVAAKSVVVVVVVVGIFKWIVYA